MTTSLAFPEAAKSRVTRGKPSVCDSRSGLYAAVVLCLGPNQILSTVLAEQRELSHMTVKQCEVSCSEPGSLSSCRLDAYCLDRERFQTWVLRGPERAGQCLAALGTGLPGYNLRLRCCCNDAGAEKGKLVEEFCCQAGL